MVSLKINANDPINLERILIEDIYRFKNLPVMSIDPDNPLKFNETRLAVLDDVRLLEKLVKQLGRLRR